MLDLLNKDEEWTDAPVQTRGRNIAKTLLGILAIGAILLVPHSCELYKMYRDHSKIKISWREAVVRGHKSAYNVRYDNDSLFICAEKAFYQKGRNPFRRED